MKVLDWVSENADLVVVLAFIILLGSVLVGLFFVTDDTPRLEHSCLLETTKPRRYTVETQTCEEYQNGEWVTIEYQIKYNEAAKEIKD